LAIVEETLGMGGYKISRAKTYKRVGKVFMPSLSGLKMTGVAHQ
jgi:hypothetical protein